MLFALALAIIAGFADVLGGFLSVAKTVSHNTLNYFIAVSAGFILAVTILDIYPEVVGSLSFGPALILIGFTLIFILENMFATKAHGSASSPQVQEHEHTLMGKHFEGDVLQKQAVWAAFLGLMVHTFFDGAAIAARLISSPTGGILVFLAVLSHKTPEGFSMSSIFLAGGQKRTKAFISAAALGLSTVVGALAVYLTRQTEFSMVFLGLAAGSFTYIVTSELVPFITGSKNKKGIWFFLLGILLYTATSKLLSTFLGID